MDEFLKYLSENYDKGNTTISFGFVGKSDRTGEVYFHLPNGDSETKDFTISVSEDANGCVVRKRF